MLLKIDDFSKVEPPLKENNEDHKMNSHDKLDLDYNLLKCSK